MKYKIDTANQMCKTYYASRISNCLPLRILFHSLNAKEMNDFVLNYSTLFCVILLNNYKYVRHKTSRFTQNINIFT